MSYRHDKYATYEAMITQAQGKSDMTVDDRASQKKADSWTDNIDYPTAVRLSLNGDTDGAKRLSKELVTNVSQFRMAHGRLDPVYRVDEGNWIDVDRYVRGEPEVWGSMVQMDEQSVSRRIAIVVNVGAPFRMTSSDFDKIAIQLGSMILGLQSLGNCVSVYVSSVNTCDENTWVHSAPLNLGGAALDISRLSAILRPWFLRRIVFALRETTDTLQRQKHRVSHLYGNYGKTGRLTPEILEEITGEKNAIGINIAEYRTENSEKIKQHILDKLKRG